MKALTCLIVGTVLVTGLVFWRQHRARSVVVVVPAPTRALGLQTHRVPMDAANGRPGSRQYRDPWAALRAGDAAAFVQLLREAGCPEETVRLFATAAIGREAQRRVEAPERAKAKASVYWREDWHREKPQWPAEMIRQRVNLERTLSGLLGIQGSEMRREFVEFFHPKDWLDDHRRTELTALVTRQRAELQAVSTVTLDDAQRAELLEVRNRHRAELEQVLGPEALAEYDLRESTESNYVRQHLPQAKSEAEFRLLVAAARDVGFTEDDVLTDQYPAGAQVERPHLRQRILARFREISDPARAEEFQGAVEDEDQRAEEQRKVVEEKRSLADLQQLARRGGIELTDDEARLFSAAMRQRGAELDQELGDPSKLPESERDALMLRLRNELDKAATSTLGDKGHIIVDEMWKRDRPHR